MSARVYKLFQRSVEAKMQVGEELAPLIDNASDMLVSALVAEKKILACGNGPCAALAQIFTSFLLDHFEKERPGLPAIHLGSSFPASAISADGNFDESFSRQVRALGQEDDVLVAICSSGNSSNIIQAVTAAHDRHMSVIALTGQDGGSLGQALLSYDVELCARVPSRGNIHEIHLLSLLSLCDLIDHKLFGID